MSQLVCIDRQSFKLSTCSQNVINHLFGTVLSCAFPLRLIRRNGFHEGSHQRVDKPSHSLSVLRAGAHECQIRSAPVLVLPRAAKVFFHAEKNKGLKSSSF
ncbi:hypothetical protein C883_3363 [Bacillus stratosphericus LAMA 585]|nr:hypothetical protein C883_3363 [Bacillus stratosphericus LAMA 585]